MHNLWILLLLLFVSCQESFTISGASIATPQSSWLKQLGFESMGANTSAIETCQDMEIDSQGSIFCAGLTSSSLGESNAGGQDAFIAKFNSSGTLQWVKQLGATTLPTATGDDYFYKLDLDSSGNIYAVGTTASDLTETTAGGNDTFVAKFNSAGSLLWVKQFGATTLPSATSNEYPYAMDLDSNSNLYIGGVTTSSLFEANGGSYDIFLMKLDSDGNVLWNKQLGGVSAPGAASSGSDSCNKLIYKSDSEIYCAGNSQSSLGEANGGGNDAVLIKFNSAGTITWIKQLGTSLGANTSGNEQFTSLAVDNDGNIFCAGISSGDLAETNGGGGLADIIITKFTPLGNLSWIKQWGQLTFPDGETSAADLPQSMQFDSKGNIYLSGMTTGSLGESFGGGTRNAFVAKANSVGEKIWIKQLGAETLPNVTQVSTNIASSLDIYQDQPIVVGRTSSNYVETNTGNAGDIFLLKLTSDGHLDL